MKVKGISYINSGIRFSKYGDLYLRLKPGHWIRICITTLQKLKREAREKGYDFTIERIDKKKVK